MTTADTKGPPASPIHASRPLTGIPVSTRSAPAHARPAASTRTPACGSSTSVRVSTMKVATPIPVPTIAAKVIA